MMDFTFLKGDSVAFFRSDAITAEWVQEELNVHCVFPYLPDKEIERGMIILFQDPATDDWHAHIVRQIQQYTESQQVEAEDIAITELSSCHIPDKKEYTDKTAQAALADLLTGTGWNVGNVSSNPVSSGDISRGSVWDNVTNITEGWNVHILPRVTVGTSGITGRYLDIISSEGTSRGLRLAVNKNMTDPCITYDDSELCTALYGYGGTYSEGSGKDKETLEYNFSSVVWKKTSEHPAKPSGQKYLEYPEMTALYDLNGRPRFGYYQNTNIKDPEILLQKTWETLKTVCQPKVSITGTVTDLKRLGYADVPLRLYDLAIIEIEPLGIQLYKQVIKLTVNLLDPTKNLPTIGDYIPNIIYINRETESFATGGGKGSGGGGGGKGRTMEELDESKIVTDIYDTGEAIVIVSQKTEKVENDLVVQTGRIDVAYDKITLEVSERKGADNALSSRITQTAREIRLEVEDKTNTASIIAGINSQSGSYVKIKAATINLSGYVTASELEAANARINNLISGSTQVRLLNVVRAKGNTLEFGTCTLTYIKTKLMVYNGTTVHWRTMNVDGNTIRYLGA